MPKIPNASCGGFSPKKLRAAMKKRFGQASDPSRMRGLLLANGITADVRAYLEGDTQPSVPTLCAIAAILGVKVDDLVDRPKIAGGGS